VLGSDASAAACASSTERTSCENVAGRLTLAQDADPIGASLALELVRELKAKDSQALKATTVEELDRQHGGAA
jgi:hypothetical protein